MKFRKKPVVIDAWQWDEKTSTRLMLESEGMKVTGHTGHVDRPDECKNLGVRTLEGSLYAAPGDWIIRGIKGEFYPIKPDIFEATYEPADE